MDKQRIVNELVDSERIYVNRLQVAVDVFHDMLHAHRYETRALFSSIPVILPHHKLLLEDLTSNTRSVGESFVRLVRNIPLLFIYR